MKKAIITLAIGVPVSVCSGLYMRRATEELHRHTKSTFEDIALEIGTLGICCGVGFAFGGFIKDVIDHVAKS